jgi:hypothetical protein
MPPARTVHPHMERGRWFCRRPGGGAGSSPAVPTTRPELDGHCVQTALHAWRGGQREDHLACHRAVPAWFDSGRAH